MTEQIEIKIIVKGRKQAEKDISRVDDRFERMRKNIEENSDKMIKRGLKRLQDTFGKLSRRFEVVATFVKDNLDAAFSGLNRTLSRVGRSISSVVSGPLIRIRSVLMNIVQTALRPLIAIFDKLKSVASFAFGKVQVAIQGVVRILRPLGSAFIGVGQIIVGTLGKITGKLVQGAAKVAEWAGQVFGAVGKVVGKFAGAAGPIVGAIGNIIGKLSLLSAAVVGIGGVIAFQIGKRAIGAFEKLEKATLGLSSVTEKKLGKKALPLAKKAAQELAADGLLTVAEASESLKNLIATGFELDEAIKLMEGMKDAAAFNREGMLGFGEAIVRATGGIKNQNSILVDNVGITKNLSIIMKERGFAMEDLSDKTKSAAAREALYQGLLEESALFEGDAAKAAGTLSGQKSKLNATMQTLLATIGESLAPVLAKLLDKITPVINAIGVWAEENMPLIMEKLEKFTNETLVMLRPELEKLWGNIKDVIQVLKDILFPAEATDTSFSSIAETIQTQLTGVLRNLIDILNTTLKYIKEHPEQVEGMIRAFRKLILYGSGLLTFLLSVANRIQGIIEKVNAFNDAVKTLRGESTVTSAELENWRRIQSGEEYSGGGIVPHMQTGGIVPGNRFSGDTVPAMLNSGEMVLNRGQQGALFKLLRTLAQQPSQIINVSGNNFAGGNRSAMQQENNFVQLLTSVAR